MNFIRFSSLGLMLLAMVPEAGAVSVLIDPAPLTRVFDNFNDGVSSATGFNNMADAGESGGVSTVSMPPGAFDPQFRFPTPGAAFSVTTFPYLRVNSRGSVAGGSQIFPLPPSAATVMNYGTGTSFGESRLSFVPPASGAGLRIDPLGGGTGVTESFEYDYIMLDRVPTIGLAEFDRDGSLDGWTVVGNGHIANGSTSAATSTFMATTAGVDPVLQRAGLAIDTSVYTTIELRAAFDPASSSRFEIFWGTNTFPGPAGGQSIVLQNELVRDGSLHTYRLDMSDEQAWNGTLNILRLDPLADGDAAAGRFFEIDYIRVLDGSAIPEPSPVLLVLGAALLFTGRRRRRG